MDSCRICVFSYIILSNLVAFFMYGLDKWKAKTQCKKRISEKNLLLIAALGGGVGALCAMFLFRHKIRKCRFLLEVPFFIVVYAFLYAAFFFEF